MREGVSREVQMRSNVGITVLRAGLPDTIRKGKGESEVRIRTLC